MSWIVSALVERTVIAIGLYCDLNLALVTSDDFIFLPYIVDGSFMQLTLIVTESEVDNAQ